MTAEFGFPQRSKIKKHLTNIYNGKIILYETKKTD